MSENKTEKTETKTVSAKVNPVFDVNSLYPSVMYDRDLP